MQLPTKRDIVLDLVNGLCLIQDKIKATRELMTLMMV